MRNRQYQWQYLKSPAVCPAASIPTKLTVQLTAAACFMGVIASCTMALYSCPSAKAHTGRRLPTHLRAALAACTEPHHTNQPAIRAIKLTKNTRPTTCQQVQHHLCECCVCHCCSQHLQHKVCKLCPYRWQSTTQAGLLIKEVHLKLSALKPAPLSTYRFRPDSILISFRVVPLLQCHILLLLYTAAHILLVPTGHPLMVF